MMSKPEIVRQLSFSLDTYNETVCSTWNDRQRSLKVIGNSLDRLVYLVPIRDQTSNSAVAKRPRDAQ